METFVTEFQVHRLVLTNDGARLENKKMTFWKLATVPKRNPIDFTELARRVGVVVEEFARENNIRAEEEKFLPR